MSARSTPTAIVLSLLAALTVPACHPGGAANSPSSQAAPVPPAHEISEWLLGEQVRGTKTRNRGINVGVITLGLSPNAPPTRTKQPDSCALDLVQLIPIRSGAWLAIDAPGQLLRYAGSGWYPVSSKLRLPPIGKLLAITGSAPRLELLVTRKDRPSELALLTLLHEQVTAIQSADLTAFNDRRRVLEHYDSGRCLEHARDCIHLATADQSLFLMREPELFANWVQITALTQGTVFDVRYSDPSGTKIDMLTTEACTREPAPTLVSEQSASREPTP